MRVCILVNEYPPDRRAGTAVVTQVLARFLVQKGNDVFVVVTERAEGSLPVSRDQGVAVHRLDAGKIFMIRWCLRILRIRRIIRKIRPHVIHGQAISCGFYARIAAWGRNIPVLTSIQGRDLYESSLLQRLTEVRWALRGAHWVVTVNQELANLGEKTAGIRGIEVIHNGFIPETDIAEREILRKQYGLKNNEFVIICVARLIKAKGLDILLRSLSAVPDSIVWIVGEGEEEQALETLRHQLKLENRVHFLGFLPHRSVAERMKAADLFVLPSRSEPFGIVLLEAMNAGLPVAATCVGGIPELIGPDNGILVPPDNPAVLASALRQIRETPDLRFSMSRANLTKSETYHWDTICEKYLNRYQRLTAN